MNEKLFLEGIELLVEESALLILKRGMFGGVVFSGAIGQQKQDKEFPISKLPEGILNKVLAVLQKQHPDIETREDLEKFIKKQPKKIRFSMVGNRLRLVNDGSKKQDVSMSDKILRAKHGKA